MDLHSYGSGTTTGSVGKAPAQRTTSHMLAALKLFVVLLCVLCTIAHLHAPVSCQHSMGFDQPM